MESVTARVRRCRQWQQSKQVSVCVAYEDYSTGTRASELCRTLGDELGSRSGVVKRMWGLNELRIPRLREIAASEAAASQLVVISVHDADTLPPEAAEWIKAWSSREAGSNRTLVALLDPPQLPGPGSVRSILANTARDTGMEFVALQYVGQDLAG